MDFAGRLSELTRFLDARGLAYAGAEELALHAYGITRATSRLELVVEAQARPALLAWLESLGYTALHVSEGYSNHVHASPGMGRFDFLYVDEQTARALFGGATMAEVVPGRILPVPRPEHLAAMKILAMKNDPKRTLHEMADIQSILGLPGVSPEIRGYFASHGLKEKFDEIQRLSS